MQVAGRDPHGRLRDRRGAASVVARRSVSDRSVRVGPHCARHRPDRPTNHARASERQARSALSGTPDLPLHVEPLAELAFDRTRRGHTDSGECVGVGSAFPHVVFCEYAFRIAGTADVVRSDGSHDGGRNRLLERPGRAERSQTAVSARHRFYLCALQCSLAPLLLDFASRSVPKRVAPLCPGLQFLQFPFCLRRAVSFLTDSRTGMWPSLRSIIARLLASKAANDPFEPVPFSRVAPSPQLPDSPIAAHREGKFAAVSIALSDWLPQPAAFDHSGRRDGADAGRFRSVGTDERVRIEDALRRKPRVSMRGRAEPELARIGELALRKGVVPRRVDSSDQYCVYERNDGGSDGRGG